MSLTRTSRRKHHSSSYATARYTFPNSHSSVDSENGSHPGRTLLSGEGALVNVTNPVQFSVDGRYLAACDTAGRGYATIRIWDTGTWQVIKEIVDDNGGGCHAEAFSRDGRFLLRVLDPSGRSESNVIACTPLL